MSYIYFPSGPGHKTKILLKNHISLFFIKSFKARITIFGTKKAQTSLIHYLEEKSKIQSYFRKYWGKGCFKLPARNFK